MCGIVGIVDAKNPIEQHVLDRATDIMAHRGPDDRGTHILARAGSHVGLGHRRLSIIDLSMNGRQPMSNEDGTVWITYNGEVYNFPKVRVLLEARGHKFRSGTDTEVVVHAYEEWGVNCLDHLHGMFAFAIWDAPRRRLFVARDRLGIKPVYYATTSGGIAVASEIKALLQIPGVSREVSLDNVARYLLFLWAPDPHTPFARIDKLSPGHYLIFENGSARVSQYWDVPFDGTFVAEDDCLSRLTSVLRDSVERHLISDVPLGVFLSGGVDSSSLLAMMRELSDAPLAAYTVGFGEEGLRYDIIPDDTRYARLAANYVGNVNHSEIVLDPDVAELWPKIVWHLDEPIGDTAALSTYLICREARGKTKVMLAGVGGDELFAGYPRHLAMRLAEYYRLCPEVVRRPLDAIVRRLPASRPGRMTAFYRGAKKFTKSAALPFDERYIAYFSYYTQEELQRLWDGTLPHPEKGGTGEIGRYLNRLAHLGPTNRQLYLDQKAFLPCLNLMYSDKASMAASVEVRVPLLDDELVSLAAGIPEKLKLKGVGQKLVLKKAMEGRLPRDVIWRRKAGFGGPVRAWVSKDLRGMISDVLSPQSIRRRGLFDAAEVERLMKDQFAGLEDNANRIWELLTLELWFRTFVDEKGEAPIVV